MIQKSKFKSILFKAVPLWMVVFIVINSSMIMGIAQYYFFRQQMQKNLQALAKTTKNPEELVAVLKQEVLPQKGYMTSLKWKDLLKKLVEVGAIDKQKYAEEAKYLDADPNSNLWINEENAHFMVNTLWALGLTNKSKVLDEGPMKTGNTPTGNFASTGGWTLGAKPAMELYSSRTIIPLTSEQQNLVKLIAESVFRPCCGNSTAFPDCNHGMAALGYIEWAVYNGLPEQQIYKDLLAFNSFWFPQNYIEMAAYFDNAGTKWKNVDAKTVLGKDYSSSAGAVRIRQSVQNLPLGNQGSGCGA